MNLKEKIKVLIKSLQLTCKYLFLSFFSKKTVKGNASGINYFTVSLTSYGNRVNFVFLTIESIIQQNYSPSSIILWLYNNDKPSFFSAIFLARQVRRGVKIVYLDEDYRSFKKLSYVFDGNVASEFYVTADDDVFYPKDWLLGFQSKIKSHPGFVYCYRGRVIDFDESLSVSSYSDWKLAEKKDIVGKNLLPTGVSGICYPALALDKRIKEFEVINHICPYADDIWYKMITTANGYESCLVNESSEHFIPIITGFAKGLEKYNVYQDRNTSQFRESAKYFNLNSNDFK
jgi:hypothetical protein